MPDEIATPAFVLRARPYGESDRIVTFITEQHGKVTGIASLAAWTLSPAQTFFGRLVDKTGSFDLGLAIAGCLPLLAYAFLWLFWDPPQSKTLVKP